MGKIYELTLLKDFKDEVAASVKTAFKIDGVKRVAQYLDIDNGYAREIAYRREAPLGNLERCIKALGLTNGAYYYAVVIPYSVAKRYGVKKEELQVFSLRELSSLEEPINHFESELFDVDNNLYRNCLRYWRHHVYNGITTISAMREYTGLSDRTVFNALHLNLNPRCTTIQKLLAVYGCHLGILKSPCKLTAKKIKMKY